MQFSCMTKHLKKCVQSFPNRVKLFPLSRKVVEILFSSNRKKESQTNITNQLEIRLNKALNSRPIAIIVRLSQICN